MRPLPDARTAPYAPEPRRESIRAWLAGALVAAFLVLTFLFVALVALGSMEVAAAEDLAPLTLTPFFGLASTAVGFYYAWTRN